MGVARKKRGGSKEKMGARVQLAGDQGSADRSPQSGPFFLLFLLVFKFIYFGLLDYLEMGLEFGRTSIQHSHFLNLAPTLGRVKSSILHGAWRFHLFF
jgi:hypothetical protein